MCRFLLIKSEKAVKPEKFLQEFALRCQKSKTLDGDWQGDGWGVAVKCQNWKLYKSLKPIWKDQGKFGEFPETKMFIVHARSASFPSHKGIVEYNQPYIKDDCCFVFNGNLKGVSLNQKVAGKIGAQKIFNLLLEQLKCYNPKKALRKVEQLLLKNSRHIEALNIGFIYKDKFYILCQYQSSDDEYFSIRYNKGKDFTIITSESFGNYSFKKMKKGEIKVF